MNDEEFMHRFDAQSREQRQRTRQVILEAGRPDVLAEFDANMRKLDLGITTAQSSWDALSALQARVLAVVGAGGYLVRTRYAPWYYSYFGEPHAIDRICRLPTARNLCARELLHVDGGVFDPESKLVITERGRFVLRHGHLLKMW